MLKGVAFALLACFVWGFIFVIPVFLEEFSPIEIALGRYFFYGVVSLVILLKLRLKGLCKYSVDTWKTAFIYSLLVTIVFYTSLVLGVQNASADTCALIIGICPIASAFYGNWLQKECSYKSLILPSLMILSGLLIINVPKMMRSPSLDNYLFGLVCSFIALLTWSWYIVSNARFLKNNPHVSSLDWSTLIGVATFVWVVLFSSIVWEFFDDFLELDKHFSYGMQLTNFLIGSAILGLLCSWVGAFLWNTACLYLPVSLAGQLTIFETIFGIAFIYAMERSLPPWSECVGVAFLLFAVIYGVQSSSKATMQDVVA